MSFSEVVAGRILHIRGLSTRQNYDFVCIYQLSRRIGMNAEQNLETRETLDPKPLLGCMPRVWMPWCRKPKTLLVPCQMRVQLRDHVQRRSPEWEMLGETLHHDIYALPKVRRSPALICLMRLPVTSCRHGLWEVTRWETSIQKSQSRIFLPVALEALSIMFPWEPAARSTQTLDCKHSSTWGVCSVDHGSSDLGPSPPIWSRNMNMPMCAGHSTGGFWRRPENTCPAGGALRGMSNMIVFDAYKLLWLLRTLRTHTN